MGTDRFTCKTKGVKVRCSIILCGGIDGDQKDLHVTQTCAVRRGNEEPIPRDLFEKGGKLRFVAATRPHPSLDAGNSLLVDVDPDGRKSSCRKCARNGKPNGSKTHNAELALSCTDSLHQLVVRGGLRLTTVNHKSQGLRGSRSSHLLNRLSARSAARSLDDRPGSFSRENRPGLNHKRDGYPGREPLGPKTHWLPDSLRA